MASFRPVNTTLVPAPSSQQSEESSPLTPRPSTAPTSMLQTMNRDDATTPTRANFGALASQRPLPATSTFPPVPALPSTVTPPPTTTTLNRGGSQYSAKSRESGEMDVDESEEEEGSDDESVNADGTRSSKKKGKSQRFYCTEYPPCNLSFTRSEHLARHIRKHTGERPFQCHCSRRFSRLDNLRQHAQTVHQNEEIPQDSLAATGTRFQRQVRTDRVRPPGSRSRASTAGSQSGAIRGHQRNSLSASSIGSVGSTYSQTAAERRRPPALIVAGDNRGRFSQEAYRPESPSSQYQYRPPSPSGFSTPTSATFSNTPNSPRWNMQSPASSHSRTNSLYGHRTPGRRLSVPSAGNPFQSPHGTSYGPPLLGQLNTSNSGAYSPGSSMLSSPTTSTSGSTWSRRESISNAADEAWRRRTWHPETYSTFNTSFTSRLQNVMTPNYYSTGTPPQPPVVPSNAPPLPQQSMRLPGIESFDPLPPRPTTPIRRQPSPMVIDTPSRIPPPQPTEPQQFDRPSSQHWDMGINRNLNRLELNQTTPTDAASSWASEAHRAVQAQAEHARAQPAVRFEESSYSRPPPASSRAPYQQHQHHVSAPPITPRESKRQAWYHGPVSQPVQRTSPAESSGSEGGNPTTPSSAHISEYNPGIVHASGWVENRSGNPPAPPPPPQERRVDNGYGQYQQQGNGHVERGTYTYSSTPAQQHGVSGGMGNPPSVPKSGNDDLLRLQALVAVATSEENSAAAY